MRITEYLAHYRDKAIYPRWARDIGCSEMPLLGRHERPTAYSYTEVNPMPVTGVTVVGTESKKPFEAAKIVPTFVPDL